MVAMSELDRDPPASPYRPAAKPLRLVVVSAGASDPSSTRMFADRIAARVAALASSRGHEVTVDVIDLRELANEVSTALVAQLAGPKLEQAVATLGDADGIIACAPVYKAGASGLFTSFFHVLDNDLLIAKPVILAATAGTSRHALVVDEQMRALFAYLRTMTVPTSLFASTEDWADPGLNKRIDRAAIEVVLLMESGFADQIRDAAWHSYQHEFGSAGGTELSIDLDSDLMRLAAGGSLAPDGGPAAADEHKTAP
jgi:FMN reductase